MLLLTTHFCCLQVTAQAIFSLPVDLMDFNEQVRRKAQNTLLNLTFLCVICLLV